MLIVFAGLPATGKTTLAKQLARRLKAVYVRIDTIEDAMREAGVPQGEIGAAGYVVAYGIARENLLLEATVVADCVNPLAITRDAWLAVGRDSQARVVEVEVICSNETVHRRRLEEREVGVQEERRLTWEGVQAREYETWTRAHLVVDTVRFSVDEAEEIVLRALETGTRG